MKLYPHNYFEILALLVALISWRNLKHTYYILFIPFLAFIVTIELTGKYINQILKQHNAWLYNISVPLEFLFYCFIFYTAFKLRTSKIITLGLMTLFSLFTIATLIANGIDPFNSLALLAGNFVAIIISCFYFYELLNIPEKVSLIRTPLLWIASGLFLFNLGEFVYSTFLMMLDNNWDKGAKIFRMINNQLLLLFYTCIIIALLWVKKSSTSAKTSVL